MQQKDQKIITSILENVVDIAPVLGKGEVNRVYIVQLRDEQVVVRLNDKEELSRFKKEAWCIEEASKMNIPVPPVIKIGETADCAFMVLEFVPGFNGEEIVNDKEHIWFTIGSYARKIHQINTSGFGENMLNQGEFEDTWDRFLSYNIESLNNTDPLLDLSAISDDDSSLLKKIFSDLADTKFDFGLVHRDLSLVNVIVDREKINLIDWGSAEVSIVPHAEILSILDDSLNESDSLFGKFLEGYGISKSEFTKLRPQLWSLSLLIATDKLRWAIDRKPEKIDEFVKKFKKILAQI